MSFKFVNSLYLTIYHRFYALMLIDAGCTVTFNLNLFAKLVKIKTTQYLTPLKIQNDKSLIKWH